MSEEKRILYDNLINLINECIREDNINTLLETIEYVARLFNIYLKLRENDIALIQLKQFNDRTARLIILNKHGLEIKIDLYPDLDARKYLDSISMSYVLVNRYD